MHPDFHQLLERRYEALLDLHERQTRRLEDHAERLDFNDRLVARGPTEPRPTLGTPEP